MGGFRPIPWRRKPASLEATALYWRWMVENGRRNGRKFPEHYLEIRYEELVTDPQNVLQKLGSFLGQELDYAQIQNQKLGRLSESNSSFRDSNTPDEFIPIQRWKRMLSAREVAGLEGLVGDCLQESGYELAAPQPIADGNLRRSWMRAIYPPLLDAKLWLKTRTTAGRFSNLSALELSDEPEDGHP
jgi:sulfotransferase family protein